jgi:hypothetical protein
MIRVWPCRFLVALWKLCKTGYFFRPVRPLELSHVHKRFVCCGQGFDKYGCTRPAGYECTLSRNRRIRHIRAGDWTCRDVPRARGSPASASQLLSDNHMTHVPATTWLTTWTSKLPRSAHAYTYHTLTPNTHCHHTNTPYFVCSLTASLPADLRLDWLPVDFLLTLSQLLSHHLGFASLNHPTPFVLTASLPVHCLHCLFAVLLSPYSIVSSAVNRAVSEQ